MMTGDRRLQTDPRVLNPHGEVIVIPTWLIRQLDRMHMLYWDRKAKKYRMTAQVLTLLELSNDMSGFLPKPLRAFNAEHVGCAPKDSGKVNPILRALGRDCRGLNVSTEETRIMEDDYRRVTTRETRDFQAQYVVDEVTGHEQR